MDDDAIRVAAGLHLGVPLCRPHTCHPRLAHNDLNRHGNLSMTLPQFVGESWTDFIQAYIQATYDYKPRLLPTVININEHHVK